MAKQINNDKLNKLINTIRNDNGKANLSSYEIALDALNDSVKEADADTARNKLNNKIELYKAQLNNILARQAKQTAAGRPNPGTDSYIERVQNNIDEAVFNAGDGFDTYLIGLTERVKSNKARLESFGSSKESAYEQGYNRPVTIGDEEVHFYYDWNMDDTQEVTVKPIIVESLNFRNEVVTNVEGFIVTKSFKAGNKRFGVGSIISHIEDWDEEEQVGGFFPEGTTHQEIEEDTVGGLDRDFRPFSVINKGINGVKTVA